MTVYKKSTWRRGPTLVATGEEERSSALERLRLIDAHRPAAGGLFPYQVRWIPTPAHALPPDATRTRDGTPIQTTQHFLDADLAALLQEHDTLRAAYDALSAVHRGLIAALHPLTEEETG